MKKVLMYLLLIIYAFLSFYKVINVYLNVAIWIILLVYTFIFIKNYKQRIRNLVNRLQIIFIILTIYLMIYFSFGLITGYGKSIYNHSIFGILSNILIYIFPIICQEYIRNILLRSKINKYNFMFVILLFTLFDLNINMFLNVSNEILFKKIFEIILSSFAKNIFITYLTYIGGFLCNLMYLIPQLIFQLIVPILPNLNWYISSMLNIILPFISFLIINNLNNKSTNNMSKRSLRNESIIHYTPIIIFTIVFFMFMLGIFKYEPVAIMSNSMQPIYSRGDAVIVEKIKNKEELEVNDIIEFNLNGVFTLHRIIAIEKYNNGNIIYVTKGDNNNNIDKDKVSDEQVIGKVKFVIPKVGYPSVLLNEILNKGENM